MPATLSADRYFKEIGLTPRVSRLKDAYFGPCPRYVSNGLGSLPNAASTTRSLVDIQTTLDFLSTCHQSVTNLSSIAWYKPLRTPNSYI